MKKGKYRSKIPSSFRSDVTRRCHSRIIEALRFSIPSSSVTLHGIYVRGPIKLAKMTDYARMETMLGTWTVAETIVTPAKEEVKVFAVAHVMKSPTRGYACELDGCSILDGNVCMAECECCKSCVSMSNTTVHASDLSVFFNLGIASSAVNATELSTNGWIGPYSAVVTPIAENSTKFQLRYVHTSDTEYLHGHANATLYSGGADFANVLGKHALQKSIDTQTNYSAYSVDSLIGTCDNGNIQPLLPVLQFDFSKKSARSKFERMTPFLSYGMLLSQNQSKMLGIDEGALTGPFCYKNTTNSR